MTGEAVISLEGSGMLMLNIMEGAVRGVVA